MVRSAPTQVTLAAAAAPHRLAREPYREAWKGPTHSERKQEVGAAVAAAAAAEAGGGPIPHPMQARLAGKGAAGWPHYEGIVTVPFPLPR